MSSATWVSGLTQNETLVAKFIQSAIISIGNKEYDGAVLALQAALNNLPDNPESRGVRENIQRRIDVIAEQRKA